jgi:CRISPR/Cas system CSM-associated protein Csm3 (group 7 of RAMP superfamily)
MFKQLFNEAKLTLRIEPDGPILIKAGEGGADPRRPDMEFVRTICQGRETIYLPGSSLKGVLRAHCERLARTVQPQELSRSLSERRLSCDPLDEKASCGDQWIKAKKNSSIDSDVAYARSCFICRLFGNTALASRLRISDAYPKVRVLTEERNGVAIDRVFGSVAVGPFNYEVATTGAFIGTIHIRNFTIAQLGLLALALRDLDAQRVGVGFAKSRGLGRVRAAVEEISFRYPACALGDTLTLLGNDKPGTTTAELAGLGAFAPNGNYGLNNGDKTPLPENVQLTTDDWDEPVLTLTDAVQINDLWRKCAKQWRAAVERTAGTK